MLPRREFLMKLHTYKKRDILKWYIAEKLDGHRAFWDGGITRGMRKEEVPWANTLKDARYVKEQVATGLWSSYGHVIHAPEAWLNLLPAIPLDGELYKKGFRQSISSAVKKQEPVDSEWEGIRLHVFDIPPLQEFAVDGRLPDKREMRGCWKWLKPLTTDLLYQEKPCNSFANRYRQMCHVVPENDSCTLIHHEIIEDEDQVATFLASVEEGVVLRSPYNLWEPQRSHTALKYKLTQDDEGIVTGYVAGRGKHEGRMGALVIDWKGRRVELSGFTDDERVLMNDSMLEPGEEVPGNVESRHFPRGTVVTFRYRTLTANGQPEEARYWRKRDDRS